MNVQSLQEFLSNRRRRVFLGVFFVFAAVALVKAIELVSLDRLENNWPTAKAERVQESVQAISETFQRNQETTYRFARELAQNEELPTWLASDSREHKIALFEYLRTSNAANQYSVEVFNDDESLIAWDGRTVEGLADLIRRTQSSRSNPYSVVLPGAIYSYLSVVVPVLATDTPVGVVAVSRALDVNYPLSNRFLQRTGLAGELSALLGLPVEFQLSPDAQTSENVQSVSVPLHGIDGRILGYALFGRVGRSEYLQEVQQRFEDLIHSLLALGLIGLVLLGYLYVRRFLSPFWWFVVLTGFLWGVRYAWLWLEFPSALLEWQIFDPKFFASPFGGGLAASMGELLITSLFLVVNSWALFRTVLRDLLLEGTPRQSAGGGLLALLGVPVVSIVVVLLFRAYAASVESAVFDSTLSYIDPTRMFPDLPVGTMLLILFLMAASLLLVSLAGFLFCLRTSHQFFKKQFHPGVFVVSVFVIFAGLFASLYHRPLLPIFLYLFFVAILSVLSVGLWHLVRTGYSPLRFRHLTLFSVGVILLLTPVLDHLDHRREREQVQTLAEETTRPADTWLSFVVEQTLRQIAEDEEVRQVLRGDHSERMSKLAFTSWAKSLLSSEGYNCSIAFFGPRGEERSTFSIGPHDAQRVVNPTLEMDATPGISVHEQKSILGTVKSYSGSVSILDETGTSIGIIDVILFAGQRSLFRGETPEVLRSYGRERSESHFRPASVSEFVDNRMVFTTAENFPLGRVVPTEVIERYESSPARYVWVDETIEGTQYETLYVFGDGGTVLLALTMEQLDLRWHMFNLFKVVFFFLLLGLLVWISIVVVRYLLGHRYRIDFGHKVLGSLLFVALIPIVLLAFYNRQLVLDRMEEITTQRLRDELDVIELHLRDILEQGVAHFQDVVDDEFCWRVANEVGTDFNVYLGGRLHASTKPELFEADLLDRRSSGESYVNVLLKGKNFFRETESIGRYPYVVGYKPIAVDDSNIVGVIGVPTLYRQSEIDEQLAKRNAFIFGVYALVVVFVVGGGAVFAHRIAKPIRNLTAATKRIAGGELGFEIPSDRTDEIGDLVDSFNAMSRDLKIDREVLARVERELAWREMAKQVAHEIKNPLTPLKLSIQHLRQAYKDRARDWNEIFDGVTRTMLEQIETLSHIASEFSRLARMPRRGDMLCNLNQIVQEAVALFAQEPGIDFQSKYDDTIGEILADPEELRRAFINILRNSVQAIQAKPSSVGSIVVETRHTDGSISIKIEDNGCGIPDDVKGKLFQPNFSTKTDGMGLGLVLVRQTILQLQGTIKVESTVGKGTQVVVHLPLRKQSDDEKNP